MSQWVAAFIGRLQELGWTEGRNITIEYRWAEGRSERSTEIVAEFVQLKVDVIVTYGTAAVLIAKRATSEIPIVFAGAANPVGNGLVVSLAHPGGNITGMSIQQTDSTGKRVELLRQLAPQVRRVAIMAHTGSAGAMLELSEVQAVAVTLGLQASRLEIRRPEDIAPGIEALRGRADALVVVTDPLLFSNWKRIHAVALDTRLPTMCNYREWVEAGCLMAYGPNYPDLWRRTAEFTDKILRGAKPSEIPVEQPTRFDLVINLKTAKALGLTIPPMLLGRADEVIQ
jgi:putative ABC transport system substrate-binding protein